MSQTPIFHLLASTLQEYHGDCGESSAVFTKCEDRYNYGLFLEFIIIINSVHELHVYQKSPLAYNLCPITYVIFQLCAVFMSIRLNFVYVPFFGKKIRHLMPGHAGKDSLNNFEKHQALQESHSRNKSIHFRRRSGVSPSVH